MLYYQEYESQIVTTQHNTTQPNTFLSVVETCVINKEGGGQSGQRHPHHQGHHNPPGPDKWAAAIGFKLIQTPTKFL